ncbi:MAG TPA: endo alpha-1,4 polygalactosaminidase [Streptosporangiaceae bacterium]|nr:endo alpha-1,4 polygalactosaminidase [Streptosporangiaceae bacterium]
MAITPPGQTARLAGIATCVLALASLSVDPPATAGSTHVTGGTSIAALRIPPPVPQGRLRIIGPLRDGATVAASGLSWHPPRLPRGTTLLSFEVAYHWQRCSAGGHGCMRAADLTVTPFAAARYIVGHGDTGARLRLTETAAEVVETSPATFSFRVIRRSVSHLARAAVQAYPARGRPGTELVNGTPERYTSSPEEYFQVNAPHYNSADGRPVQLYRIDQGSWRPLPGSRALYTGKLRPGPHLVAVRTSNRVGSSTIRFGWHVVPMPKPLPCQSSHHWRCWYPQHLAADHHPMRWDWQIGRVTPLQRTGRHAVDIYDIDGFLTSQAEVRTIHASWQARTLRHPRTACYLDMAWEDYRPDASPGRGGSRYFPAAALGNVYYGYPEERWLDFRQLDALKPMLRERISMCARKGFDAVELDDIDSFDPPSTTGFRLTPGDAQNFLAYAFNEIHRFGMTALWKNSPYLSWWGRRYADGAVVEECYINHACFASWLRGSRQYGITCTSLTRGTPCGWDAFSSDVTRNQPTGKWVGEAEYAADKFVCNPGQHCGHKRAFATFCHIVYAPRAGFAAVKFDVNLDGKMFYPCPHGS